MMRWWMRYLYLSHNLPSDRGQELVDLQKKKRRRAKILIYLYKWDDVRWDEVEDEMVDGWW